MTRPAVYLMAKRRLVRLPGLLLPGAVHRILLLLTLGFSLGSFLVIQPVGFDDCSQGQRIQPFRIDNHPKSRLVGGLVEVERAL